MWNSRPIRTPSTDFVFAQSDHSRSTSIQLSLRYGVVPKGCPMAIYLSLPMIEMGPWAPDRWRTEDVRSKFLAFGGAQPHECRVASEWWVQWWGGERGGAKKEGWFLKGEDWSHFLSTVVSNRSSKGTG